MSRIQFDFHVIKLQNERVGEVKTALRNLINEEYAGTVRDLRSSWEGEAATLFRSKMEQQEEHMRHTIVLLENVQRSLEEACSKMEAVEYKTAEIAKNRTYH